MNVYCSHPNARPFGPGGFLICGLCGGEWYSMDPAPLRVIGFTSTTDLDRYKFLKELRAKQYKDKL